MNEQMNGWSQFCSVVSVGPWAGDASHLSLGLLTCEKDRRPSTTENCHKKQMRP